MPEGRGVPAELPDLFGGFVLHFLERRNATGFAIDIFQNVESVRASNRIAVRLVRRENKSFLDEIATDAEFR